MAVICVKSGIVLWSTARDKPSHSSTPWGKLVTLNHTTLAYIISSPFSLVGTLCVRDVLTGEIKATKPIPDNFLPLPSTDKISIQLHPRRGLVYITVPSKALFFSATTANCVGRLNIGRPFPANVPHPQDRPTKLRFSERQPKYSPSDREKFFLCKHSTPGVYFFEYEVPTDEEISTSEARILENGGQGSEENLVFEIKRIEIYEHCARGAEGPPELNPMLKRSANTETGPVRGGNYYTRVRFNSFSGHRSVSPAAYDIFLEQENRFADGSIPTELYSWGEKNVLVTKQKRTPGHARKHSERTDCIVPEPFNVPITLTERYMLLFAREHNVYLFSYEPRW